MNEDIEYIHICTSDEKLDAFGYGEWVEEPDEAIFEHMGYKCYVMRNPNAGCFCAYVLIPKDHPFYKKKYNDLDVSVHGGLSFGDMVEKKERLFQNKKKLWNADFGYWIGMDFGHAFDIMPLTNKSDSRVYSIFPPEYSGTYKNIEYVINECKSLAQQVHDAANIKTTDN